MGTEHIKINVKPFKGIKRVTCLIYSLIPQKDPFLV